MPLRLRAGPAACPYLQPRPRRVPAVQDPNIAAKRAAALYSADERAVIRRAHENPAVIALYRDFLGAPLSPLVGVPCLLVPPSGERSAVERWRKEGALGKGRRLRQRSQAALSPPALARCARLQAEKLLHTHYVAGSPTLFDWRLLIDGFSGSGNTGPGSGTGPGTNARQASSGCLQRP